MDEVRVRAATADDVEAIVELIAADQISAERESTADLTPYRDAFRRIADDPNQVLVVLDRAGVVIGTLQLTFIPGLSRRGASRGLIEAVRVSSAERGAGLGSMLIEWAVERARSEGCALVQLTSDARRTEAHRFYGRLGFEATHVGFKRKL